VLLTRASDRTRLELQCIYWAFQSALECCHGGNHRVLDARPDGLRAAVAADFKNMLNSARALRVEPLPDKLSTEGSLNGICLGLPHRVGVELADGHGGCRVQAGTH